jgi:dTDP-4-amino-4,6-dideoxygalactose transaminase
LHKSVYYSTRYSGDELRMCDMYADCLIRLPFYFELDLERTEIVAKAIRDFFND